MPRKSRSKSVPAYRRQPSKTGSDRAFVSLGVAEHPLDDGRQHRVMQRFYLGTWDSPESREKYHRLLAEYAANGNVMPTSSEGEPLTVAELIAGYIDHEVMPRHARAGELTTHGRTILHALSVLRKLYGRTPAAVRGLREGDLRQIAAGRGVAGTVSG